MLNTLMNMVSHLRNCSRARLALVSVPSTKHTLKLCTALQKSGFLSTVVRAGKHPPDLLTMTSMPQASEEKAKEEAEVTQENIASRRLWLGLKYWNNEPVISDIQMVSRAKKRVTLSVGELKHVIRGRERNYVKGLTNPGECLFILTDKGCMEAREAEQQHVGGLVICRVV